MLTRANDGRTRRLAVALLGLSVVASAGACGDDGKSGNPDETENPDAGTVVNRPDSGPGLDASRGMDGARPDAKVGDTDENPDGAVSDDAAAAPTTDGAVDALDATSPDARASDAAADATAPDATAPDSSAPDASSPDAGNDAGNDAGGTLVDAGSDAGSDAATPHCDVNHPIYGCGTVHGETWVSFPSGLEFDRQSKLAWSPQFEYTNNAELVAKCYALDINGLSDWAVPAIADIRTMASGCAATTALAAPPTADQCAVVVTDVAESAAGTCTCTGGTGPDNGKFCKPDVPSCVTLWTRTSCGSSCTEQKNWFYDVSTGSIRLELPTSDLAKSAKARCVMLVNAPLVP